MKQKFDLSETDRAAIYDHLQVIGDSMNEAKEYLRTAQGRLDAIAAILNKMVPPLR